MSQPEQQRKFAAALLAQDAKIGEPQFKEYRMQLEEKLANAARSEKRARWLAIVVWAVAMLLPLGILVVDRIQRGMSALPPMHLALPLEMHAAPGVIGNVVGIVYMVTVLAAWIVLLLYVLKYRASLRRSQGEYQAAVMADLQRQLAEIRRQLPGAGA